MNIAGKTVGVNQIVAAVGGLLAIVGALLAWITIEGISVTGLDKDLNGGKVELLLGILVVALVVAAVLNVKIPQPDLILAVLGVLVLVVLVLVYFTSMLSNPSFKDAMDAASAFGASVSLGIGFFLEVIAGILVIVGGGMGLMKKSA